VATLRDIKRRIGSVNNIQQITQAMRMVSAAKLRKAAEESVAVQPYTDKTEKLLIRLVNQMPSENSPLLQRQKCENVVIVIISADRGLCGAFNSNLIRRTSNLIENDYSSQYRNNRVRLYCLGRKGYDHFRKKDYSIMGNQINFFNNLEFKTARSTVENLVSAYLEGSIDRVEIVYARFRPPVLHDIVVKRLLPILGVEKADSQEMGDIVSYVDYLYEPSKDAIIDELIPKYLNIQMWRTLLDSRASEEGARVVAMENATENAKELISDLTLLYNRTRQAAITNEIAEIVGGAEALRES